MAGVIADAVGEVNNPKDVKDVAEQIFLNLLKDEDNPPEIAILGLDALGNFISEFTYDDIKNKLLKAARKINKK